MKHDSNAKAAGDFIAVDNRYKDNVIDTTARCNSWLIGTEDPAVFEAIYLLPCQLPLTSLEKLACLILPLV
jgi:hypothetical protein